jgi:phage recombination protein Bet
MTQTQHNSQTRRTNHQQQNKRKTSQDSNSQKSQNAQDIVARSVRRSGLPNESFVRLIIQSALSRLSIWSQADLERLLLTAERLGLDPLNNEIYALEKSAEAGQKAQIIFVVGVDGWTKLINAHPAFDGMKFVESEPGDNELPLYFQCTIFRKDRRVATSVREYMYEVHTNKGAWLTHPRRMLRHKAMVQCARLCFGLSGIYDPDEALRIQEIHPLTTNVNKSQVAKACQIEASSLGSKFLKTWVSKFPVSKEQTDPDPIPLPLRS